MKNASENKPKDCSAKASHESTDYTTLLYYFYYTFNLYFIF